MTTTNIEALESLVEQPSDGGTTTAIGKAAR